MVTYVQGIGYMGMIMFGIFLFITYSFSRRLMLFSFYGFIISFTIIMVMFIMKIFFINIGKGGVS